QQDRWVLLNHYKRWWIKPSTDFTRCGKEIFDKLNPDQKVLLGFSSIPPRDHVTRTKTLRKKEDIPEDYEDALSS
ncbi:MAG: hypothetical protein ACTSV1_02540, partial [Alphaproteobacteria bacterium]